VKFRTKRFGLLYGCGLFLLTLSLTATVPAKAQDRNSSTSEDSTLTGTVVSSTRSTLVIRGDDNQYRLFTFDSGGRRPRVIPVGAQVRVTSSATVDPGVRSASSDTVVSPPPAAGSTPASPAAVPPEMRRVERDIERQVSRFQGGVRAGVALDPDLVLIGVQAQVGPFFDPNVYLRPNVEFAFGEVTALFALNLEAIYRLPVTSRQGRWSTYVGVGPGFNFLHQNFERNDGSGKRIDFGDFHSAVGLNILGGLRYRSGVFLELKTSVYASPAPTLRMIVGYNF
jgi:hypothetical protein